LKDEWRRALERDIPLRETPRRGPGGRAPSLGTPKDMLSKALEMGVCFHRTPPLEKKEGRSFLSAFEKRGEQNI